MTVEWTAHRFSGGRLVLDIANSVVLRGEPSRSFDRFADAAELPQFAAAATVHRADELGGVRLVCHDPIPAVGGLVRFREAADALFRKAVHTRGLDAPLLADLMAACAVLMADEAATFGVPGQPFGAPGDEISLGPAAAWSALSLLRAPETRRIRICGHCGWLFVDRSRNGSRLWCDMAVCGNRRKARRHYQRHRRGKEASHE